MTSFTRLLTGAVFAGLALVACSPTAGPGAQDTSPESSPSATSASPTTVVSTPAVETTVPEPSVSPSIDPTATGPATTPSVAAVVALTDTGDKVRELQHRLWQIDWLEGDITEQYDERTVLAVEGFQAKRGLPVLGYVDQATWDRLVEMTRTLTHDEMYNIMTPGPALMSRGDKGDDVKDLQARLRQIGWFSGDVTGNFGSKTEQSVRGFQAKREIPVTGEVDQRTLDRLQAMTRKPTKDELNNVGTSSGGGKMTLDDRCLQGRVICISKAQRRLAWVVDGDIRMTMDVRFGSELTPTRNGVFSVYWKSKDHVSSLYHTPMPYAMFFSGGQAVHYSADFAARGYNGSSHGCVNVRDKAAVRDLFNAVREGDTVVVY